MEQLDNLFKFPVLLIDKGDDEAANRMGFIPKDAEKKRIIHGEAEYPYFHFIGIEDSWMPFDDESVERAAEGEFEACVVRFLNVGAMIVPLNKNDFKKQFNSFVNNLEKRKVEEEEKRSLITLKIDPRKLADLVKRETGQMGDKRDEE